jgi:hypothetical protein
MKKKKQRWKISQYCPFKRVYVHPDALVGIADKEEALAIPLKNFGKIS